jgi:drug/metabolite transporter (DMT)-like permease
VTVMNAHSHQTSGSFVAVLGAFAAIYIVWGTTYLAIAISLQTLPPFVSGSLRFLIAGAIMFAWLRWKQSRPLEGVNLFAAAATGVLLTGIGNGFVVWSQQGIPSGIAALIVTAVPVAVLVLDSAFFSRRAPTKMALAGTGVAVAGVATIVVHTHSLSGAVHAMHLIALIVATLAWSLGTLVQKRHANRANVLSFTCAQMLFGGLFQLVLSVIDREWVAIELSRISLSSILAVAYLIVFGSLIGLNAYLWLLTRVSAPKVTTYALVNPVVALLLGAAVLDERITPLTIGATCLVLSGVALVLFQDWRPKLSWSRRARSRIAEASIVETCE